MRKNLRLMMSLAFACASVLRLDAQTPAGAQSRTSPGKISVTGCVERADQMSAPSAPGTTVDSLSFVLIHATKAGAAGRPDAVSTTGTTRDAEKGSTYRLNADVSKLNPHVGHKVEVTGSLDAAPAVDASVDPTSAANAPKLTVDTVKMLSETCAR